MTCFMLKQPWAPFYSNVVSLVYIYPFFLTLSFKLIHSRTYGPSAASLVNNLLSPFQFSVTLLDIFQ